MQSSTIYIYFRLHWTDSPEETRLKKIIKAKLPRFITRFPILPLEKTYETNEENYYFDLSRPVNIICIHFSTDVC